jgi:hypothetical protein
MRYLIAYKDGSQKIVDVLPADGQKAQAALLAKKNIYLGDAYISHDTVSRLEPYHREEPNAPRKEVPHFLLSEPTTKEGKFWREVILLNFQRKQEGKRWIFNQEIDQLRRQYPRQSPAELFATLPDHSAAPVASDKKQAYLQVVRKQREQKGEEILFT